MTNLVKCLVWDLDGTLWDGTLIEGDEIILRPKIRRILDELTQRGIINSIASRNEEQMALAVLRQFGLADYFTASQINWDPKTDHLRLIAQTLNLDLDALALIDDDPFEREAVRFSLPSVNVIEAGRYDEILDMPAFQPTMLTDEAKQRLQFYQTEANRKDAERSFAGTRLDFLKSCEIRLTLLCAQEADIPRIVELAERTNQINTTGIRYNFKEIASLLNMPNYRVIIAELSDRFGDYGKIGAMILRLNTDVHILESLMVSCRADGRGIPSALLLFAVHLARHANARHLEARYRRTERNRPLGILYQMMGFRRLEGSSGDGLTTWIFDHREQDIPEVPKWLTLTIPFDVLIGEANVRRVHLQ